MRTNSTSLIHLGLSLALATACGGGKSADAGSGGGSATGGGTSAVGGGAAGGTSTGGGGGGSASTGGGSSQDSGTGGSGGGTSIGTGGGSGVTVDMLCNQLSAARCARAIRCSTLDSANQGLCIAREEATCTSSVQAISAGIYTYDGNAAQQCINALATAACSDATEPGACSSFEVPAATVGERCLGTCAVGYCQGAGMNSCASCVGYSGVGQTCTGSQDFGGQRCNPDTAWCPDGNGAFLPDGGQRLCLADVPDGTDCSKTAILQDPPCTRCIARADGGSSCGYQGLGELCQSVDACGPTAYCKGLFADCYIICNISRFGVCTARLANGATCVNEQADDGCSDGGTCLDSTCVMTPKHTRTVGQECDEVDQCLDTAYCAGLVAAPADGGARGGTCADRIPSGDPCQDQQFNPGTSVDPCALGTHCPAFGSGTCSAYVSAGGACSNASMCKAELDCFKQDGGLTETGVCRVPASPGGNCGNDGFPVNQGISCSSEIAPLDYCQRDGGNLLTAGQCTAPQGLGVACVTSESCLSGRCFNPDGGPNNLSCQARCY